MAYRMVAIEYNMWRSIILLLDTIINSDHSKYGYVDVGHIDILPTYPRDLTKFTKPSIIVQKIGTDISSNGFIGQYYDDDLDSYYDVFGMTNETAMQLDVCCNNNIQRSLVTDMVNDILFDIIAHDGGQIPIYNYVPLIKDPNATPELIGYAKLGTDIDIQNLDRKYRSDSNEYKSSNYDYATAIRFDISIIQVVIPEQEMIDLTKPIKITQHVIL